MRNTSRQKPQRGFTIVELIVIIVVIGILAAITIVSYNAVTDNATKQAVQTDAQSVASQLTKYKSERGAYPQDFTQLNGSTTQATIQYSYDDISAGYCFTASLKSYSVFVRSGNTSPSEGTCLGHGSNGKAALVNYAFDPNATSLSNFSAGTGGTNTLRTDAPYSGTSYIRRTANTANTTGTTIGTSTTSYIPVTRGKTYTISAWVRANRSIPQYMYISWITESGSTSGTLSSGTGVTVGTSWTRVSWTGVVPGGDVGFSGSTPRYAAVSIRPGSSFVSPTSWAVNDYQDIDGIMANEGSDLNDFKDGSSPGCSWSGTPNASASFCLQY